MIKKLFKQKNSGFTLVETLVAVSIFTMSILGLMSVLASGISDTNYAKKKMAATYLAQEGIEYARNLRDTDVLTPGQGWSFFHDRPDTIPFPADSNFTRTVWKATIGADEIKIFSKVEWTQGSGNYNITFSENLFNWIE